MNLKKSKAASTVMAAAACLVMSAAGDLPKELEGTPKDQIQDVSQYIYGPKTEDPEASGAKAVVYVPAANAKQYGGIGMGVYDKEYSAKTKKVIAWSRPKPADEKYHWYKISRTGKDAELQGSKFGATIYLENWKIGARLPKTFKGKYDCWVLVRAQGPFYVAGSTKENKLFLKKVILAPVK